MRTRTLKLLHYGIDDAEKDILTNLAKQEKNAALVRVSAEESNPGIADALFLSLTTGKGFRHVDKEKYILLKEDDFYAYRRRALYIFKLLLKGREAEKNTGV